MSTSGRPKHVIILFGSSLFFVLMTFGPFLYSILFPNDDIQRFVSALEGKGEAPMDGDSVSAQVKSALGPVTKSIQVGCGYQKVDRYQLRGAKEATQMNVTQQIYLAWFQKRQKPLFISVALYSLDSGQKTYRVSSVAGSSIALQYGFPVSLLGLSLFLMCRRNHSEAILCTPARLPYAAKTNEVSRTQSDANF